VARGFKHKLDPLRNLNEAWRGDEGNGKASITESLDYEKMNWKLRGKKGVKGSYVSRGTIPTKRR